MENHGFDENYIGKELPLEEPEETPQEVPEPEGGVPIEQEVKTKEEPVETQEEPTKTLDVKSKKEILSEEYDAIMKEVNEYRALRPHWERFKEDPKSFLEEFNIKVQTSEKTYEQEFEEECEKIRAKFGEDFTPIAEDMMNPKSDTAKYQRMINETQYALMEKHKFNQAGVSETIKDREKIWVNGSKEIVDLTESAKKEFNIQDNDLAPGFSEILSAANKKNSDESKISLVKLALKYYINSEFGLRNKVLKQKIEEKVAASDKVKTTNPKSLKSQIRSDGQKYVPFQEETEFFSSI